MSENYKISTKDKDYFLKKYRFNDKEKIQEVHSSKKYFCEGGIPVIMPIETEDEKHILIWFLETSENPEKKKMLLGSKSMEKLAELGSARDWINWLKEVFDQNEVENRKLAEQELQRKRPEGEDALEEKWKITIRLYSASHSIRQKVLNKWKTQIYTP